MINRYHKEKNKGFTMVELIVILVVLGILLAAAVPAMLGYFKGVNMRERDDSARLIYMTAQNRLTALKATGEYPDYIKKEQSESDPHIVKIPDGVLDENGEELKGSFYYMTDDGVAELVGISAMDPELFSGDSRILLELDVKSGEVYGVFYTKYGDLSAGRLEYGNSDSKYVIPKDSRSYEARSTGSKRIGYYGGDGAAKDYQNSIKAPSLEIVNAEELYLNITSIDKKEIISRIKNYIVTVYSEKDEYKEAKFEKSVDAADLNKTGEEEQQISCSLLFDSLADGYSFPEIFDENNSDNTDGRFKHIDGAGEILPGENIRIKVTAVEEDKSQSISNYVDVNSLFAEKKEDEVGKTEVSIVFERHLQNLDYISGENNNTDLNVEDTTVTQENDLDWNNVKAYFNRVAIGAIGSKSIPQMYSVSDGSDREPLKDRVTDQFIFHAISDGDSAPVEYTYNGKAIKNMFIHGEKYAGLFGRSAGNIKGVKLINPCVTCKGEINVAEVTSAGALVGFYEGANISNCSAYLDKEATSDNPLTQTDLSDLYTNQKISGGKNAGGLVGSIVGDSTTATRIENCFAALQVTDASGYVGGFIGNAVHTEIEKCYSTGRVSPKHTTGVESNIGGFAGYLGEGTKTENCYTVSNIVEENADYVGGFAGKYEGASLSKSYCAGGHIGVSTYLKFIGTGIAVGEKCYYLEDNSGILIDYGAQSLTYAQVKGEVNIQDGAYLRKLDIILGEGDGWGYFPAADPTTTHPYYIEAPEETLGDVYPFPAFETLEHYGDWPLIKINVGSAIYYYEEYQGGYIGYYFSPSSLIQETSDGYPIDEKDKEIINTGYGLLIRELDNGKAPTESDVNITDAHYYSVSGTQLPLSDFELQSTTYVKTINGVKYYGFKIVKSEISKSGNEPDEGEWQDFLNGSYKGAARAYYNGIEFSYGELTYRFNPCFGKMLDQKSEETEFTAENFGLRMDNLPFVVRTEAQLKGVDGFGQYKQADQFYNFKQERHIKLEEKDWKPLCRFDENNESYGFNGVYDSDGIVRKIDNLLLTQKSAQLLEQNFGLFDTVNTGVIKNISVLTARPGVTNTIVYNLNKEKKQVDAFFGILAGQCKKDSYLINCNVNILSQISFKNTSAVGKNWADVYSRTYIGGLVGKTDGTIQGCQVIGKETLLNEENREVCTGGFAGIVGQNGRIISLDENVPSMTHTSVSANGFSAGFVAENYGTIINAYSGGTVGTAKSGQMLKAGFVAVNSGLIENCQSGLEEDPVEVIHGGSTENASVGGFVAINGKDAESINAEDGVIRNCNAFVEVTSKRGTYAAGFAALNSQTISDCTANIVLVSSGNYAAGFVGKNSQGFIESITYKQENEHGVLESDYRSNKFTDGKGLIENCQVKYSNGFRETPVILSERDAAGFAGASDGIIESCSVDGAIQAKSTNQHVTAAGFILENSGTVDLCYANAFVTANDGGLGKHVVAAGFAIQQKQGGSITKSYADCITSSSSSSGGYGLNSIASGFISENAGTIASCYSLLEVSANTTAPSAKGSASGFVYNNSGGSIRGCYSAVSLYEGTQTAFGNNKGTYSNCFYLKFSGSIDAGNATAVSSPVSEEELHSDNMLSKLGTGIGEQVWELVQDSENTTYPNSPSLQGQPYPYPKIIGLAHYGDWPEDVGIDNSIFYYEKYEGKETDIGYFYYDNNYRVQNSLNQDKSKKIVDWGYGVISSAGDVSQVNQNVKVYHKNGVQADIRTDLVDASFGKQIIQGGSTFKFYPFADKEQITNLIKGNADQYLYIDSGNKGDVAFLFNPCFAAAILSKNVYGNDSTPGEVSLGTEKNPYQIRYSDQLYYMVEKGFERGASQYRYFKQTYDLDLSQNFYSGADTEQWTPDEFSSSEYSQENPFVGNYDGNGNLIKGLKIDGQEGEFSGLFGYIGSRTNAEGKIEAGVVKNLTISIAGAFKYPAVNETEAVGILAGKAEADAKIVNCKLIAAADAEITIAGGTASGKNIGLLVGSSDGSISDCQIGKEKKGKTDTEIRVAIDSEAGNLSYGAIAGENNGSITNGKVYGVMLANAGADIVIGGVTGKNTGDILDGEIADYKMQDNSAGENSTAGFSAQNEGTIRGGRARNIEMSGNTVYGFAAVNAATGVIEESFVSEVGLDAADKAVGFVGQNEGRIASSYVQGTIKVQNEDTIPTIGNTAVGFCYENNGAINEECSTDTTVTGWGNGTQAAGFVYRNAGSIVGTDQLPVTVKGKITTNPEGDVSAGGETAGFVLLNEGKISYGGYLGNEISGNESACGFALVNSGEITFSYVNSEDTQASISAAGNKPIAAGFVLQNSKSGVIRTCNATASVQAQGAGKAGGIAADNEGTIANSYAKGSVNADDAAGFVISNKKTGLIKESCYTNSAVTGTNDISGFVWENSGTITGNQRQYIIAENTVLEITEAKTLPDSTVSGFAVSNTGKMTYCSVKTKSFDGNTASGFVKFNQKQGLIGQSVVESEQISGDKVAGFAYENQDKAYLNESSVRVSEIHGDDEAIGFAKLNSQGAEIQTCNAVIQKLTSSKTETGKTGLVCGLTRANEGIIRSSSVDIKELSGGEAYGFAADNQGSIRYGEMKGERIYGDERSVGFVGDNGGTVINSYTLGSVILGKENSSANVDKTGYSSGFAGTNSEKGIIKRSYANCEVVTNVQGVNASGFLNYSVSGSVVENCFSAGPVKAMGKDTIVAGFISDTDEGAVSNCYAAATPSALADKDRYAFGRMEKARNSNFYLQLQGMEGVQVPDKAEIITFEQILDLTIRLNQNSGEQTSIWTDYTESAGAVYPCAYLKELPEPIANFRFVSEAGMFYYEKDYEGNYHYYTLDLNGQVTNDISQDYLSGNILDAGYGVFCSESKKDSLKLMFSGKEVGKGEVLSEGSGEVYYKLNSKDSGRYDIQFKQDGAVDGETAAYFYINPSFAQAIQWVSGKAETIPDNLLGEDEAHAYGIRTAQDFQNVNDYKDKYFIQLCDIDLSGLVNTFIPIGGMESSAAFTGNYNGGGFDIKNMKIEKGDLKLSEQYLGLFGNNNGTIVDTHVSGTIHHNGFANSSDRGFSIGGLAGYNGVQGNINSCSADVSILTNGGNAQYSGEQGFYGGFVGQNSGQITGCYSSGNIQTRNGLYTGGFCGAQLSQEEQSKAVISDSYCTGNPMKPSQNGFQPGQFAGYGGSGDKSIYNNCFAYNKTILSSATAYGFLWNGSAEFSNCYILVLDGKNYTALLHGGTALNPAGFGDETLFKGFDFTSSGIWIKPSDDTDIDGKYPFPGIRGNLQRYHYYDYRAGTDIADSYILDIIESAGIVEERSDGMGKLQSESEIADDTDSSLQPFTDEVSGGNDKKVGQKSECSNSAEETDQTSKVED